MTLSPLAPDRFPDLPVIKGVRFAAVSAEVKYKDRDDVMVAVMAPETAIAGVFTKSATRSAPVLDCQAKLGGEIFAPAVFLVNSGNSNAFTGSAGERSVEEICASAAAVFDVPQTRIFTASTGVIGERLPHGQIINKISDLDARLSPSSIESAARAIMTTDTFPKGASAEIIIDGKPVRIAGIAKGSGMIAPDMATMLVYIFTDAEIAQPDLQVLLGTLTDSTFNCITVDSDTSTSDTLMCAATGASGVDVTDSAGFTQALRGVMLDLAHQVVRDGEGATKFVEIRVSGAASDAEARTVGLSIANSPLVKTAIAGEDPNWGRIVMAVGKSGAQANRDKLTIRFGDIVVAENGWVSSDYSEDLGAEYMKQQNLAINVDLGIGGGLGTVWTCDLTHGYITINADYRS
ncbi:bifunctional glutamate N-acetyltransferase/amino-acid acetyltransferase ArgJ [Octadecabacter sp.]|jgi:glutamate N-acetyltransferase/amino-acid N-acetyltransferase|nr:bifunctional glutamate N-acetyltransferase/amino-acid acetyltransferase ArgJ [Octadecabacter sp.]MDB4122079.1 bifunctional glutamate N-acetyltransferase/amino-acid acetyltransferase ArgJ [Octadecabacter sp.]MDC1297345.1 bifunctional glutamate N-acetyltransferase/amino-acid acetyltransferase ArgJ [Octadecabacter sp.]MDC1396693.1 bifunctional glutamate N-acetyltransferase/amino-acid acetyltransferase ArgJ [Octadecabacter sp.]MDC1500690.1 bifunctional glutamate N-acetyltransferase/amino-acid ac